MGPPSQNHELASLALKKHNPEKYATSAQYTCTEFFKGLLASDSNCILKVLPNAQNICPLSLCHCTVFQDHGGPKDPFSYGMQGDMAANPKTVQNMFSRGMSAFVRGMSCPLFVNELRNVTDCMLIMSIDYRVRVSLFCSQKPEGRTSFFSKL